MRPLLRKFNALPGILKRPWLLLNFLNFLVVGRYKFWRCLRLLPFLVSCGKKTQLLLLLVRFMVWCAIKETIKVGTLPLPRIPCCDIFFICHQLEMLELKPPQTSMIFNESLLDIGIFLSSLLQTSVEELLGYLELFLNLHGLDGFFLRVSNATVSD